MEISNKQNDTEGRLSDVVARVKDAIRLRWLTLLIVTAVVLALGIGMIMMMTPQYYAAARVQIDPTRNPLANSPSDTLTPESIATEVANVSSIDVATAVVRKLNLINDPSFTKALKARPNYATMSPSDRETAVAQAALSKLNVDRDKLTYILSIGFTSPDPIKAARIANAFAESYIATKVGGSIGTAEQRADWYKQRLDSLAAEVREADAKVASYRAATGVVSSGPNGQTTTTADQQVGPLSLELASAESDAAAAHANLNAAQQQSAKGGVDAVSQVLNSSVITELRRQRAEILRNMGEVEANYGDKHPESIRVHDQLRSIDAQIREEANRVIASLRSTAVSADARAASLRSAMNGLQARQSAATRDAVMADALDREATAKRAQYDKLAAMSLDSTQAARNSIAQVEIVDRARPPQTPSSPKTMLLLALTVIVALGAGVGTVAVQEMLVSGMRSVDEVETQLGVPMLAAIPKQPKSSRPADLLLERPTSLFAESMRIARAAILGVKGEHPPQVIAITSALPSEGKTTTALAFARTLAINGAHTLLIECDVRRAAMTPLVGHPPKSAGIVEVLHGEATLAQALTPGDVEGLDHLLVRTPYFSSEDLFGAGTFQKLIAEVRGKYEQIVLDLPPLVGLADGRFIAVFADTTALVIRWDSTPVQAASSALSWLRADGANVAGAIFSMVDSSAEAIGGLYYSKKYAGYYQ